MHLTVVSVAVGVAIALACAWYCRRLALGKGRSTLLWTALGVVLTVVAVPVLILLPSAPGAVQEARVGRPSPSAEAGGEDKPTLSPAPPAS